MSWLMRRKARLWPRFTYLEQRETPGRFGYGSFDNSPTDPAYSRVTNPERFRPLHTAMLAIIDRLESDFEVERAEGFGLDKKLERGLNLARADVILAPRDADAPPIAVVFTAFPGLRLWLGRWYIEPFPGCGCDACDESAEATRRGEVYRRPRIQGGQESGNESRQRGEHQAPRPSMRVESIQGPAPFSSAIGQCIVMSSGSFSQMLRFFFPCSPSDTCTSFQPSHFTH